ncbi:MAG: ERF family protein [Sphaerochaeta sp.]|jgi:hypothetical protein|nr:ERF family protein [Sphaerochaeta sp.]
MKTSDSVVAISKALVKFQAEITNPARSANNPFFKSKYTPLADLIDHARPVLAKHGLAVIQSCGETEAGKTAVFTRMIHDSGEWMESDPVVMSPAKDGKETPQTVGAAITYARRYGLAPMLGVASEEDDDGNSASGLKPGASRPDFRAGGEASRPAPAAAVPERAPAAVKTAPPETPAPPAPAPTPPPAAKPLTDAERKRLAKIHALKAERGVTDDAYRAMISGIAPGMTSAKALSPVEQSRLIEALSAVGEMEPEKDTTPTSEAAGPGNNTLEFDDGTLALTITGGQVMITNMPKNTQGSLRLKCPVPLAEFLEKPMGRAFLNGFILTRTRGNPAIVAAIRRAAGLEG